MSRTYNEQAPDGSWRQVTQNDNGTYTTVPIPPTQYGAANIPGGSSPGASSFTNPDGTINQAQFNAWLQQQGTSTAGGFTSGYVTSLADQTSQLQAAGYNGPWDPASVQQAYARTYGGGNAAQPGGTLPGVDSYNSAAGSAAYQAAALAAQTAYQNALIKGASDRLAFDEATQAFAQTMQTAQLTGTYNGNPTLAAQNQADQFGLAQGQLTGMYNGSPTLAAQQQNNTAALGYLGLMKGMSGPANAFDYAHALTGTPGGLADIVRAAGGAYQMPSFGGGGNQAVAPLSIQSIIGDVNRYSPTAQTPGTSGAPTATSAATGYVPTYAPPPAPAPAAPGVALGGGLADPNLPPSMGGSGPAVGPPRPPPVMPAQAAPPIPTGQAGAGANAAYQTAYPAYQGLSATQSWNPSTGGNPSGIGIQVNPMAGQALMGQAGQLGGSYIPAYGKLPLPSQLAPQAYNRMSPSQLQLLIGAYGQGQGGQVPYLPQDVASLYQQSLKGYGGPSGGAVGF